MDTREEAEAYRPGRRPAKASFPQRDMGNSSRVLKRVRSDASDQDKWLYEKSRDFRRVLST